MRKYVLLRKGWCTTNRQINFEDCDYNAQVLTKTPVENSTCQIWYFSTSYQGQYYLRAVSDRWIGAHAVQEITLDGLVMPVNEKPHTNLLDLDPLPISALQNEGYQAMYKFTHFNPVQTQFFHSLYHTDANALVGAPTGSGKTVAAELALFRMFNTCPKGSKAVYIAPLKALVRERMDNWGRVSLGK